MRAGLRVSGARGTVAAAIGRCLLALSLVTAASFPAAAYNGQASLQVLISGPAQTVPCDSTVPITATVIELSSGGLVPTQRVEWSLDSKHRADALGSRSSLTDANGVARVTLKLGPTPGERTVTAAATGVTSRLTVRCEVGLPLTTPTPTGSRDPAAGISEVMAPAVSGPSVARVRIARLGIDVGVVDADGISVPTADLAHLDRSGWPGQGRGIVVYGHARPGLLGDLWLARGGDIIELVTAAGTARYRVERIDPLVAWNDWSYLAPRDTERLLLETCLTSDPMAPRLVVTAVPTGAG